MNHKILKTIAIACLPVMAQAQTLHNNGATLFVSSGAVVQINGDMQTQSGSLFANNGTVKVMGNVTNNQAMTTPNAGILEFVGTTAQTLDGSSEYYANDVLVNNANGVTLNTPLKVDGNVTFYNGIVNAPNASQSMHFTANGTHSNAGNTSHVLGYVVKEGTGIFTYPVGDGTTYEPMDITLSANGSGMQVQYKTTDAGAGLFSTTGTDATPLAAVNHFEHWLATPLSTATGSVTMYWNAHNNIGIFNMSDLRVAHLTAGNWQNEGATTTSGTIGAGTVTSNNISTWSPFTLGSISMNSPLPVTLLSFTGKKEATANVLNWETTQEINNAYFNVQRSTDARDFATIGKVEAKQLQINNYELRDEKPLVGYNYYRLQQVDIDGKITQSQTVVLNNSSNEVVHVYPNPVNNNLSLEFLSDENQQIVLQILDATGHIVFQQEHSSVAGFNTLHINMAQLATGFYQLKVMNHSNVLHNQKVIKQ